MLTYWQAERCLWAFQSFYSWLLSWLMYGAASSLTLRGASLCADVQVNRGLWEFKVPPRDPSFLTSHRLMWVFVSWSISTSAGIGFCGIWGRWWIEVFILLWTSSSHENSVFCFFFLLRKSLPLPEKLKNKSCVLKKSFWRTKMNWPYLSFEASVVSI